MPEVAGIGAVDCWVNPLPPGVAARPQPEFLTRVATDFPFLPFDRAVATARELPLRPEAMDKCLSGNAQRVFGWTN
ncbi:MAG: hypothetical protein HY270_12205 [Deltaproteobacteria bacterium]|nr:hypothetical protein [Deltaproteobacteria bacterium]